MSKEYLQDKCKSSPSNNVLQKKKNEKIQVGLKTECRPNVDLEEG